MGTKDADAKKEGADAKKEGAEAKAEAAPVVPVLAHRQVDDDYDDE